MKYENKNKIQNILFQIEELESSLDDLKDCNKVVFSDGAKNVQSYRILPTDSGPISNQEFIVAEFVTKLKNTIQDMIDGLKAELEKL